MNLLCIFKVFVPLTHDGARGWILNLVCPGNTKSVSHEKLLLLKNSTENRNLGFDNVCKEKQVYVAYNNQWSTFEVSNVTGEMVKYPVLPVVSYSQVAWEWEIQAAFLTHNNIKPHWINANHTWGSLNYTTGQWSGAVGMIQRDEADYAICCFAATYQRSKVAVLSAITYNPLHWLTRYPLELPPTWNLLGLFTKEQNSQMGNLCKPDL